MNRAVSRTWKEAGRARSGDVSLANINWPGERNSWREQATGMATVLVPDSRREAKIRIALTASQLRQAALREENALLRHELQERDALIQRLRAGSTAAPRLPHDRINTLARIVLEAAGRAFPRMQVLVTVGKDEDDGSVEILAAIQGPLGEQLAPREVLERRLQVLSTFAGALSSEEDGCVSLALRAVDTSDEAD